MKHQLWINLSTVGSVQLTNTTFHFITGKEIHLVPSLPKQRALYVIIGKQWCIESLRWQGVQTLTQFTRSSVIHSVVFSNTIYPTIRVLISP